MNQAPAGTPPSTNNQRIMKVLRSRGIAGRLLGRALTIITYTGHKSGKLYSMPVGYRRRGNTIVLQSKHGSETKTWWRNFLNDGRAITLWLDGAERVGHAIAVPDDQGNVIITVTFPGD